MIFTKNLRILRKKHQLRQEDLADKIGVTRGTIINWEKGVTQPDNNEMNKLSKLFNISIDEMSTGTIKDTVGAIESEEIYRNIVEGNTEYILIPRSVLQEKYRLVAVEQYERDKAQMEKDRAYLDGQFQTIQSLIAQIDKLNTKPPDVQKTQQ